MPAVLSGWPPRASQHKTKLAVLPVGRRSSDTCRGAAAPGRPGPAGRGRDARIHYPPESVEKRSASSVNQSINQSAQGLPGTDESCRQRERQTNTSGQEAWRKSCPVGYRPNVPPDRFSTSRNACTRRSRPQSISQSVNQSIRPGSAGRGRIRKAKGEGNEHKRAGGLEEVVPCCGIPTKRSAGEMLNFSQCLPAAFASSVDQSISQSISQSIYRLIGQSIN